MIPLLLALLATSTRTDVVPLTSESQLRELCGALGGPRSSLDLDPVETRDAIMQALEAAALNPDVAEFKVGVLQT